MRPKPVRSVRLPRPLVFVKCVSARRGEHGIMVGANGADPSIELEPTPDPQRGVTRHGLPRAYQEPNDPRQPDRCCLPRQGGLTDG